MHTVPRVPLKVTGWLKGVTARPPLQPLHSWMGPIIDGSVITINCPLDDLLWLLGFCNGKMSYSASLINSALGSRLAPSGDWPPALNWGEERRGGEGSRQDFWIHIYIYIYTYLHTHKTDLILRPLIQIKVNFKLLKSFDRIKRVLIYRCWNRTLSKILKKINHDNSIFISTKCNQTKSPTQYGIDMKSA